MSHQHRRCFTAYLLVLVSGACRSGDSSDSVAEPSSALMACERGSSVPVPITAVAATTIAARGGYLTELRVDRTLSRNSPPAFRRISDALVEARRLRREVDPKNGPGCRITIAVAPGVYVGATTGADTTKEALPFVLDVRDVTVRGSYDVALDSAGRPRGPATAATGTTIIATPQLALVGGLTLQTRYSEPFFLVNSENGVGGDGAVIEGFVMRSGHAATDTSTAGSGVMTFRAANVIVQRNSFEGNFSERVDLRGGSATVVRNFSSGPGGTCDICVAGPGVFDVSSNTLRDGGVPGILVVPALLLPAPSGVNQFIPPSPSFASVSITNNEISGHQRLPVGVGIRLAAIGNGASNVQGISQLVIRNNYVHHNRFGIMVEGGFPITGVGLRGDAIVEITGNVFASQCQTNLYVAFTRHSAGLGLANQPYLQNSSYRLTLGPDAPWDRAWYANLGGFGNTLTVNGAPIANGQQTAYDAAKSCP